jgi:hypothetical protein
MTTCHQWEYDPFEVQPRQQYDWDCSAAATAWLGRSTGWGWQETDVAYEFVRAGIATPRVGLLDGTGVGIVRWLANQPYPAGNLRVTYDQVVDLVRECPLIMGSSNWYHWTGVRGVSDSGVLSLANSAPGWAGIWQTMDRTRFDTFGDFYAVIPH